MDALDPIVLARLQFAANITFHILFPTISIAMGWFLLFFKTRFVATGQQHWMDAYQFWVKIFALTFALGVVSGITMSFQFGTNWPGFMNTVGNVAGPLLAYEVLTAFFLEAGFLGVMLFGINKVGRKLHFVATLAVAIGTFISAFWILSVNSWMQTPVGYEIAANGQFMPGDSWWTIIFNPSFPYRLVHTLLAAYLTTAFAVGAVGAWHLLKDKANPGARKMFSMAMWMAAIVAPLQVVAGDFHGINTLEHQPAKVMAMEGHYQSHPDGAPLILFGIPNSKERTVDYAIEIPKASSLILKHDLNAPLAGLDTIPDADEPPVGIVFWAFRIMVGLGMAMVAIGMWSLLARARKQLYEWSWLHKAALLMGPSGFIAVLAGWVVTEVGRQPFTIYGVLRTVDSASPLDAPAVAFSLLAFVVVYFAVFGMGIWYLLRLMKKAPEAHESALDGAPIRSAGITPAPAVLEGASA